jgi:16S rRNA (cytosine967-C5)-methyltransferase
MSLLKVVSVQKPRQIAARILKERLLEGKYTENLLEIELAQHSLSPVDRGLCQELVYGASRWQATLNWLVDRKTAGRTQKPLLRILLQLGLYQMFWLDRIPNHAVVNETVELAKQLGLGPQAGFVNAVLRAYTRERTETEQLLAELKAREPAKGLSHPEWLYRRWLARWGAEKTLGLMEWNNTPPPTYARVNSLKTDAAKLAARWEAEGVKFSPCDWDWAEEGLTFQLLSHPSLAGLRSFQEGLFYIQDPSTLLAVRELAPKPGETVLDLCAAPGGKTTFIGQLMQNQGQIIAQDIQPERLELVRENCERLGVTGVKLEATVPNLDLEAQNSKFDRVLVDAPCSNTGVMRRRVDLRWRIRLEEIERLRTTQLELLRRAAVQLKPGGTLVYSTCSLEPEENEAVMNEFLRTETGFKLENQRELLPFADGVDGAFVARLTRG